MRFIIFDVQVKEGGNARLECGIPTDPQPEVCWTANEVAVAESEHFQMSLGENKAILVIRNVAHGDAGRILPFFKLIFF